MLGILAASLVVFSGGVAHGAPPFPEEMYGDPDAAAPYWQRQHDSNCAEMAVADVIGEVTGRLPTEQEIDATAESLPSPYMPGGRVWRPGASSEIRDLPALLAHYGVDSRAIHTTVDRLKQELGRGHKVIAAVNFETLRSGPGRYTNVDHFVVVTGIDTDANVVHFNDSGRDGGSNVQVPLATFETSWATSNNQAVVTN